MDRKEYMLSQVESWRQSGITQRAFCDNTGIKLDNDFMNHPPEKLELNLSIQASNSVGMNLNELIFSEEIISWNVY